MHIDQITPDALRHWLRSWAHSRQLPDELLGLHILGVDGDLSPLSPAEKALRLHDLLYSIVTQELQRCRVTQGVPDNPLDGAAVDGLREDFRPGDARLEAWSGIYYRFFAPQARPVEELSRVASIDDRQLRRRVELGLKHLAEALQRAEQQAHVAAKRHHIQRHLPPADYSQLFGVAGLLEQVESWLARPDGPRFVSIEGMGGIGKTALAQTAARHLAERADLEDIVWISARQELLSAQDGLQQEENPARSLDDLVTRLADQLGLERVSGLTTPAKLEALKNLLPQRPYLVVLDNLETLEDATSIAPVLQPLTGATRFLLTSRQSLARFGYVQTLPVPELSLANSQALLERELGRRGGRWQLTRDALAEIYQMVGGLPLALKLLAAQMGHIPVGRLLEGYQNTPREKAGTLYSYLYRRTWALLDDPARRLLLAMLDISPEGEDLEWLQMVGGLPVEVFEAALEQLIDYALLETSGTVDSPIYRLHRITTTFLHTDILQDWGNAV